MKEVDIYTDGACSGNPGEGGWGVILIYKGIEKELSGFEAHTTNNRMELTAVIEGLKALKEPCRVKLYSDSAYIINALQQGWLKQWKMNGWTRGKKKEELKNTDLWQELDSLMQEHQVQWIKVKGHSDNEYNNRCDKLATGEIAKAKKGDTL
ncbi:MAG: ribonuclease HI [Clostridiaceae bacterium]|jgi:ribonuclease HI|nr:ribonuclease HI [Clostridiaceae bacterium]